MSDSLRVTEIFLSLQGEAKSMGMPTVFVRLTGCPLRCVYCDSEYAFYGGEKQTLRNIVDRVVAFGARHVCVTGGEPLAQPQALDLLRLLCDLDRAVSLETSGAMSVDQVDSRVSIVMDIKTPGSGESHRNRLENIPLLKNKDQVKFVICNRTDYEWARFKLAEWALPERVGEVLFSPSFGALEARQLADWVVQDCLPVRFQIQLHKYLWGDIPGV